MVADLWPGGPARVKKTSVADKAHSPGTPALRTTPPPPTITGVGRATGCVCFLLATPTGSSKTKGEVRTSMQVCARWSIIADSSCS